MAESIYINLATTPVCGYSICSKLKTISKNYNLVFCGQTLLLELIPIDPRSLIQGDYMQLRYAVESKVPIKEIENYSGYIVVKPDENNVAQFVRVYAGENLAPDEKLLHFYKSQYSFTQLHPNSFFFQEGRAKYYQDAKYGIFKFNGVKDYLLVGLANAERVQMEEK
jgi:uncharacterized membrane-anchored protein